eukprot:CAMPEP_0118859044 /NCGR_PEP_ID=MMETSP1163-20130328/5458_1 /TAXON_ID=124430 /ORGANISM="Phaeomonas parva, Strain CCMP2877" /LENGTH=73 /DNA_ID=CAMNT_0006792575 /DNA_START=271 /DNA_END=488 /DNA_ORIENTATION=-
MLLRKLAQRHLAPRTRLLSTLSVADVASPVALKQKFRTRLVEEMDAATGGGGPDWAKRQHGKGKLLARERLEL